MRIDVKRLRASVPRGFPRSDSDSSSFTLHTQPAVKKRGFASIDDDEQTPTKRPKDADIVLHSDAVGAPDWNLSFVTGEESFSGERALSDAEDTSLCCSSNPDLSCEESFTPFPLEVGLDPTDSAARDVVVTDDHNLDALMDVKVLFRELSAVETQVRPDPLCLENHSAAHNENYIDHLMRAIAVSWLVEVACEYGFHQETLHTAASLLDRFLSASKALSRSNLQLVSVACMLVASKNEEERYPSVQDFTSISDNCFRPEDLLRMEGVLLQSLDFRINAPTAYTFLSLLKPHIGLSPRVAALAVYLLELALLSDGLLACPGAIKAASAVLVASACEGQRLDTLTASLQSIMGVTYEDLCKCCMDMVALHQEAFHARDAPNATAPSMAIKDKFADPAWHFVSQIVPLQRICLPRPMSWRPVRDSVRTMGAVGDGQQAW
ncbi:probable cyclin-A2 at C-terminar half [Coccomyxa sp. Obi]|nr:probable cyclin-A2 at C-terminar half [Coccomyxa sp. Obi]